MRFSNWRGRILPILVPPYSVDYFRDLELARGMRDAAVKENLIQFDRLGPSGWTRIVSGILGTISKSANSKFVRRGM